MNQSPPLFILSCLCGIAAAQSAPTAQPPAPAPAPAPEQSQQTPAPATTAPAPPAAKATIPEAEQHIRKGILTLNKLYQTLLKIDNKQLADSSALEILKIQQELLAWAQGFSTLVPLNAEEQKIYEQAYLPIIQQLNEQIKAQSARLHSARYYESTDLPNVLIEFVKKVK